MEGKQRTIYHILWLLVGTAVIFISGFELIQYKFYYEAPEEPAPLVPFVDLQQVLADAVGRMPRCANACIFNEITEVGCAHSDYVCMCKNFKKLGDPCGPITKRTVDFKTCMEGCRTDVQWYSPGIVMDICDSVEVDPILPEFMAHNLRLYGRQNSTFASFSLAAPQSTVGVTVTISTSVGNVDSRTTTRVGSGPTVTEYILLPISTPSSARASGFRTATASSSSSSTASASSGTSSSNSGSSDSSSSSSSGTTRKKKGFPLGAKVGVIVAVLLLLVIVAIIAAIWVKRKNKKQAVSEGGDSENHNNSVVPGMAELSNKESQLPPAYHQPESAGPKPEQVPPVIAEHEKTYGGTVNTRLDSPQEVDSRQVTNYGITSATGGVAPQDRNTSNSPRQELSGVATTRSELPNVPAQVHSSPIGRKPVSSPMGASGSVPPPWDHNYGPDFSHYHAAELDSTTSGSIPAQGSTLNAGGDDVQAMEEEMARIKAQKERLRALQALEEREEQLRRTLEAKKGGGTT